MAETIKSVLFLDYDSVRHALEESDSNGAERLGLRLPAWIAALESGSLLTETENEGGRRRILMRRCYADPSLLDADRAIFLTNGFQVVDCPTAEGRDRNAAAIHMVLDTIDALDHPAGYEEFILLSADTDLSPILIRLRAHNRSTAIYASPETAESYKAIADALIDQTRLISVLVSEERPKPAEIVPPPAERSEIEALARKVSTATSVPLFAPRTFAELFRHLVEEIAEKGYHHQTTAENVAARMASGGRNVTRRQVVFVVKGLALKGHVFSTSDTPERLAEVFREQVLYLCENAQLAFGDREKQIMASWIVGRVQPASAGAPIETEIAAEKPAVSAPVAAAPEEAAKSAPKPAEDPSRAGRRGKPMRPMPPPPAPKPEGAAIVTPPAKPVVEPPHPAPAPPKPAEAVAPPPPPKPVEEPKPAVRTILSPKTAPPPAKPAAPVAPAAKPATIPPRPATVPPKPAAPAMPAAMLVNRPLPMPPTKPVTAASPRPAPTPPPRPAPAAVTPPAAMPDGEKDAVESSILAAIAQAVDVLVEDGGGRLSSRAASVIEAAPPSPAPEPYEIEAPAPPEAKDEPEDERHEGEGDDIGDEIQRIIASYNRTREQ